MNVELKERFEAVVQAMIGLTVSGPGPVTREESDYIDDLANMVTEVTDLDWETEVTYEHLTTDMYKSENLLEYAVEVKKNEQLRPLVEALVEFEEFREELQKGVGHYGEDSIELKERFEAIAQAMADVTTPTEQRAPQASSYILHLGHWVTKVKGMDWEREVTFGDLWTDMRETDALGHAAKVDDKLLPLAEALVQFETLRKKVQTGDGSRATSKS